MHYASTLVGMDFANAFLGLSHLLAYRSIRCDFWYSLRNCKYVNYINQAGYKRYNATDKLRKQAIFP